MKRQFEIISDPKTYEIDTHSDSFVIYGQLYIKMDDFIFPYNEWGDFVGAIAEMWLKNTVALINMEKSVHDEYWFMDGHIRLLSGGKQSVR